MRFVFNKKRSVQAVAFLIRAERGRMNYTKMLKLLYLADRRSLIETGSPITGDAMVNMSLGPVLSGIYDLIKGTDVDPVWSRVIQKEDQYSIRCVSDPGTDELSEYVIDILSELSQRHRSDDYKAVVDVVHQLKEWIDPGLGAMRPFTPVDILRAERMSDDEIAAYESMN